MDHLAQGKRSSGPRTGQLWELVSLSMRAGPTHLWLWWLCEYVRTQLLYYVFWVSIGVSYNALEIYAMVTRSMGQMKHPVLCCTLCLTCLLQLSVNICWINEWTNEYVLVTTVTKTNEIWSLPLRSSQSIEHKQQIKYWLCLLGSTFFYYRNTISSMSSCYSSRHTNETARYVKMYLGGTWKGREGFPLILQR